MAAVVRGAARSSAQPRARSAAKAGAAKRGKGQGYNPAKLSAARRAGLSPASAVSIAAAVVVLGGLAIVATDARVRAFAGRIGAGLDQQLIAQGLRVQTLTIQGATPEAQADIARATGLYRDEPILHLNLETLRDRVAQVGWVKSARVVRLLPDTIVVAVTQRPTFAVWEHGGKALVIDNTGHAIPEADPAHFANLPLVVGDGADQAAPAILPVVRAHPQVMDHLDALIRVDGRRWDLRMKDGSLIQLPASGEDAALIQLDQLDQKSRILELGFERIDMRDPSLVAVRPRETAPPGQLVANGA
ncbi:MAG: FtsQ-type POTRA domain-containing protein [Caulobacteraceae bacterium]|nr:FtsQ-type POTRA domain-containing protein [Caulobacteraceae bacterium]